MRGGNILEKRIEKELKNRVEKANGKCIKFISQGNNGMPDRIVLFPGGEIIFVETKRPKGGVLSEVQKYQHKLLRDLGQKVIVVWTIEDIEEVIPNEI